MAETDPLQFDERLGQAQRGVPDPVALDRQVARADEAYQRWLRQLPDDPECEAEPLAGHRKVSSLTTLRDLKQLGDQDPLRSYLERWILCLGERRINAPLERTLHLLRYHDRVSMPGGLAGSISRAQLLRSALPDSAGAQGWLHSYLQHARPYADAVGELWQRRAEVGRRWGRDFSELTGCGVVALEQATAWLDRTGDMFFEHRCGSLLELIALSMARNAALDWPTHLNWRALAQLFDDSELTHSLQVRSKRLPERIAPASFLLGLGRFGEEWSQALAPRDQFFVVGHDPFRLQVHTHAALFALLLCSDRFLKHRFAAPEHKLDAARRSLHLAVLIESRVRAFKVVVAQAGLNGRAELEQTFVEELNHRFGFTVPRGASGAIFVPRLEDTQRFVGLMLASALDDRLTDVHEDDWFRNPRGVDQLRSEAALPPASQVELAQFEQGASSLYARLAAQLG